MSQPTQYDMALMLESAGDFRQAFKIFKLLLCSDDHDRGDILFHCGWCLENDPSAENQCALPYYREAANTTANSVCRMNSLFRVGWLLMHEKNYHLAGMFFKEALAMHQCQQVHDGLYHEALYWYAVCLESSAHYLEALKWYRKVQVLDPLLNPESRLREIACLNQIGAYQEALLVCRSFEESPPKDFNRQRYHQLRVLAEQEHKMIEISLSDDFLSGKKK